MSKQKLTLSVDKIIFNKAKRAKINLSSFLEIRLYDYLSNNRIGRGGNRTIQQEKNQAKES
jgi:hypothetical protein